MCVKSKDASTWTSLPATMHFLHFYPRTFWSYHILVSVHAALLSNHCADPKIFHLFLKNNSAMFISLHYNTLDVFLQHSVHTANQTIRITDEPILLKKLMMSSSLTHLKLCSSSLHSPRLSKDSGPPAIWLLFIVTTGNRTPFHF